MQLIRSTLLTLGLLVSPLALAKVSVTATFSILGQRIPVKLNRRNQTRNRPRPMIFSARTRIDDHSPLLRDSVTAKPTMKRKKGKTRSVGVTPCHSACSRGA